MNSNKAFKGFGRKKFKKFNKNVKKFKFFKFRPKFKPFAPNFTLKFIICFHLTPMR